MEAKSFPDLIAKLEIMFPDKLPMNEDITPQQIAYLQGQQCVVYFIKQLYEDEHGWIAVNT